MSGVNCAIVDCGTSRRTKGIGIFKLPAAKGEGKNGSPKLRKQGLLIRSSERK